jgi:hypothetical protein
VSPHRQRGRCELLPPDNFPVLFFMHTVYNSSASTDIRKNEGMGYSMHTYVKATVVLSLLVLGAGSLQAQTLPWAMGVDSSLRLELLVGSQSAREASPPENQFDRFKFEFCPRLPVLSGTVELSPLPWASGRVAGAVSVWEPTRTMELSFGGSAPDFSAARWARHWNVRPHYSLWEAAGLLHFWNAGGYRFSGTAGYRGSAWKFYDEDHSTASNQDVFESRIPFFGLQTAMNFPLWKARFEVLGSPFMTKVVRNSFHRERTESGVFHLTSNRGGMIEFQMEGTVGLSANILCGFSARLTYEELFGTINWTNSFDSALSQSPMEGHLIETLAFFGLNATLMF